MEKVKKIKVDERMNDAIKRGSKARQMTETEFIRYVLDCVLTEEGDILR